MKISDHVKAIGQEAQGTFIEASSGNARVYFKIPSQVVRVKHHTEENGFTKVGRLITDAVNAAYALVGQKLIQIQKSKKDHKMIADFLKQQFSVTSEGDLVVVIGGDSKIRQVAYKRNVDSSLMDGFLTDVVHACNAGFIRTEQESIKLMKKYLA